MRNIKDMTLQELLSVVLRTSPESETIKELSARYSTAKSLYQAPVDEITGIKGIGAQKAFLLKTVLELGLRLAVNTKDGAPTVTSPTEVMSLLKPKMELLDREHFVVIALNTKNKVLRIETAAIGSLNSSIVHPREIFKNAIRLSAAAVILAHNHPSGDPTPSREDLEVTNRLVEAGKLIGIKVMDHIIIGDSAFTSFTEKGLI